MGEGWVGSSWHPGDLRVGRGAYGGGQVKGAVIIVSGLLDTTREGVHSLFMPATQTAAAALTIKLLALATSCVTLGLHGEAVAAVRAATIHAAKAGLDVWEMCDEDRFAGVDPTWGVKWTEETPSGISFTEGPVVGRAGCTLAVFVSSEGVRVEAYAGEDRGYRMIGRGFWRDHDVQEAVWLACDAWEIA